MSHTSNSKENNRNSIVKPQPFFRPDATRIAKNLKHRKQWLSLKHIDISDWYDWSSSPHTTEEIRERLITKPITDTCISYLCRHSQIEPDFFDEFRILTSGKFHKEGVQACWCATQPLVYSKASIDYYKKHPEEINDRIDWVHICTFQKHAKEYMVKYADLLKTSMPLTTYQNLCAMIGMSAV